MRAFIAIDIGDAARDELARAASRGAAIAPRAKWIQGDGLHVTLVFLGSIDDGAVVGVERVLAQVAAGAAPFALGVGPLGTFGHASRPSVLWASLSGDVARLREVQASLARGLAGIAPEEERPFSPHVTLARARDRRGDRELAAAADRVAPAAEHPFRVSELVLYRSDRGPAGARYTRVAVAALGASREPSPSA